MLHLDSVSPKERKDQVLCALVYFWLAGTLLNSQQRVLGEPITINGLPGKSSTGARTQTSTLPQKDDLSWQGFRGISQDDNGNWIDQGHINIVVDGNEDVRETNETNNEGLAGR